MLKLAIVGDLAKYKNKSLQDFIIESNKSNMVFFTDSIDTAFESLKNNKPHCNNKGVPDLSITGELKNFNN